MTAAVSIPADLRAFAAHFTAALGAGGFAGVRGELRGHGLPTGWEGMVGPWLDDLRGRDLRHELRPVTTFTREELQWPAGDLPAPFARVAWILVVAYGEEGDTGTTTFPVAQDGGRWVVVLAGPAA